MIPSAARSGRNRHSLPTPVQLVALATVANAGQLTDWIEKVHGPTQLVTSDHRPVPLQFSLPSQEPASSSAWGWSTSPLQGLESSERAETQGPLPEASPA